jgi:hypothetical protein
VKLDDVVPWGRSFDEYLAMFNLGEQALRGRLLGCGDGPASFNAEAAARGMDVVSVDPIFAFDGDGIRTRIETVRPQIEAGMRDDASNYVWERFRNVDELVNARIGAMERFLDDYNEGRQAGRYIAASLPSLPFEDGRFDLALVSHLLFTYSGHLDRSMHVRSVRELMRVSREVRIFPLLDMSSAQSPHLEAVIQTAEDSGWAARVERVDYEFQRGGNEVLKLLDCR